MASVPIGQLEQNTTFQSIFTLSGGVVVTTETTPPTDDSAQVVDVNQEFKVEVTWDIVDAGGGMTSHLTGFEFKSEIFFEQMGAAENEPD